jgi:hypothetical protein
MAETFREEEKARQGQTEITPVPTIATSTNPVIDEDKIVNAPKLELTRDTLTDILAK